MSPHINFENICGLIFLLLVIWYFHLTYCSLISYISVYFCTIRLRNLISEKIELCKEEEFSHRSTIDYNSVFFHHPLYSRVTCSDLLLLSHFTILKLIARNYIGDAVEENMHSSVHKLNNIMYIACYAHFRVTVQRFRSSGFHTSNKFHSTKKVSIKVWKKKQID